MIGSMAARRIETEVREVQTRMLSDAGITKKHEEAAGEDNPKREEHEEVKGTFSGIHKAKETRVREQVR